MEIWIKAAQLITSLSILVFLHELGHFIPAKLFKTRVEKFYLFFNPWFSIFKKKIGETEWGIGWLPLGGYVKIAGMIDESMDTEQMKKPAQPWEFRSKPAWQRLIIMIGGVTVNLILGYIIYAMVLFVWGRDVVKPTDLKHGYEVGEMAEKYGFQDGDIILSYDGNKVEDALGIMGKIMVRNAQSFEVLHADGTKETITLPETFAMDMWMKQQEKTMFQPRFSAVIGSLSDSLPAKSAGVQVGDSIVSVNGEKVDFYHDFIRLVGDSAVQKVTLGVVRSGKEITFEMEKENGLVGIGPRSFSAMNSIKISHIDYSFGKAITSGFSYAYWTLHDYIKQFEYVFTKRGSTAIGGFGAIANLFPPQWDWHSFWLNTALLSIMLAFMNILPIPALDGGHIMFLLYEMITGREPNQKVVEYAQIAGFFILIALMLYANGLDIIKSFF